MDLPRVLLITILPACSLGSIYEIPMPSNFQDCFDNFERRTDLKRTQGDIINWQCIQKSAKRTSQKISGVTSADEDWFQELVKEMDPTQSCNPEGAELRVRKEIRQTTEKERNQLFEAFRQLKETPYGNTTRYDFIASMHSGDLIPAAHFGPNFLPWHRFYILLMENALRQIHPEVTMPYWDTSLDSFMLLSDLKPTDSVLWTSEFVGNGDGEVITGPFQSWTTSSGMLVRNYGGTQDPSLNNFVIEKILTRTHLEEISQPTAEPEYDLLSVHGAPHVWVGGHMGGINTAAFEPVFFLYHCFIDFIFEQWQERAKAAGVDVENEWPSNAQDPHAYGATFGFGNLTNIQGMSSYFKSCVFRYQAQPNCSTVDESCGSDFLTCDTTTVTQNLTFCRSKSMEEVGEAKQRFSINNEGVQNMFCVDDNCTTENWVFLPMEIVQLRPPGYQTHRAHPVIDNHFIDSDHNIYTPEKYSDLMPPASAMELATYGQCKNKGTQDIQIQSTGLNYDGFYYEIAVPDNRLPLSKTVAYIAVRKPDDKYSQVLITASDSCGRVCKVYCRDKINKNEYYQCSGALEITPHEPLGYGRTIEDLVHGMWTINQKSCPSFSSDEVFIRIFCSYSADWYWNQAETNTSG